MQQDGLNKGHSYKLCAYNWCKYRLSTPDGGQGRYGYNGKESFVFDEFN